MSTDNFRDQNQLQERFDLDTTRGEDDQNEMWDFVRFDRSGRWNNRNTSRRCSSSRSTTSDTTTRRSTTRRSTTRTNDLCDSLFNVDLFTVPQNCRIRFLRFIECLAKSLKEEFCDIFVGLQVYRINSRQFIVIYQFEDTSDVFCELQEIDCRIRRALERNFGNNVRRCRILSIQDAELVFCSEE